MAVKRQKKNEGHGEAPVLNIDLVYEVMVWLPIETIFRCGTVCKSWYAVTKDQFFQEKVSRLQSTKTHILLRGMIENVPQLNLINVQEGKSRNFSLEPMLHELKVMSSCEGMLSMASTTKLDPAVIYNPFTGKSLVLPSRSSRMVISSIFYQQVGLGFDYATKKFKVIRAFSMHYTSRFVKKYEVLTLGKGEATKWRSLCSPRCIGRLDEYEVSYCHGALYFTTRPGCHFKVVRFNLSDETFCQVVIYHNIGRNLEHKFFSIFHDDEGSVFLAIGHSDMVGFLKLGNSMLVPGEFVFMIQSWNKITGIEWSSFNVLAQVEQDKYLVHLRFSDSSISDLRMELSGEYRPNPTEYSYLTAFRLPNKPKAFTFKPSLMPLPTLPSPPSGKTRKGRNWGKKI